MFALPNREAIRGKVGVTATGERRRNVLKTLNSRRERMGLDASNPKAARMLQPSFESMAIRMRSIALRAPSFCLSWVQLLATVL